MIVFRKRDPGSAASVAPGSVSQTALDAALASALGEALRSVRGRCRSGRRLEIAQGRAGLVMAGVELGHQW